MKCTLYLRHRDPAQPKNVSAEASVPDSEKRLPKVTKVSGHVAEAA